MCWGQWPRSPCRTHARLALSAGVREAAETDAHFRAGRPWPRGTRKPGRVRCSHVALTEPLPQPSGESASLFVVQGLSTCLLDHHCFWSFTDPLGASVPWRTPGAPHALPPYLRSPAGLASLEVAPRGWGEGLAGLAQWGGRPSGRESMERHKGGGQKQGFFGGCPQADSRGSGETTGRKVGTLRWQVRVKVGALLRQDVPDTKRAASPGAGPLWLGAAGRGEPLRGCRQLCPRDAVSAREQEPSSTPLHVGGARTGAGNRVVGGSERLSVPTSSQREEPRSPAPGHPSEPPPVRRGAPEPSQSCLPLGPPQTEKRRVSPRQRKSRGATSHGARVA